MNQDFDEKSPLASHSLSEKEKKYDRQLRLWAAHGQQALESADILLINTGSGVVGVETLKNLVLPGIGKYTIIDESIVGEADLGVNFFLNEGSLGKSRAECCSKLLQELNPDVKGEFHSSLDIVYLRSLFEKHRFSLVLCTLPVQFEVLTNIKKLTFQSGIPLILTHSVGFYSYFRSILPINIPIVDTHPEIEATTDLRLLSPWKELSEFSESLTKDLEHLSDHKHGHIPYVALLLHFLADWKKVYGKFPLTYSEKMKFRKKVAASARKNAEGSEENFHEAVAAVMKAVKIPIFPSAVREVFDHKPNSSEAKSSFWIIVDAIKQFYEKNNQLPLPGSLPDMKAETTTYVQLQNIYKAKARQDVAEVYEIALKHSYGKNVQIADVENFCKNTAHVKLIHALDETTTDITKILNAEFEKDESAVFTSQPLSLLPIYIVLNANSHELKPTLKTIIANVEKEIPGVLSNKKIQTVSQEISRAKGGELHNISALTGGMIAQEIIKIITKQYIPIDNTCIFDGIASRAQVLRI